MTGAAPVLSAPADAASALTLIRRAPPPHFAPWLAALPAGRWPDGRFLAHIRDIAAGMRELFSQCGTPPDESALWWADDVSALAARFVEITGEAHVDVRLERVTDNACVRFHRDNVPVRLVTTYAGPGTEIVPADQGPEALARQLAYSGPVSRLAPGDIAIFRGGPDGVVHRSPQIAGTGAARAMLCLNTRFAGSPELWAPDDRGQSDNDGDPQMPDPQPPHPRRRPM